MDNSDRLRILVTGGCGFIGSHLVERLVNEGHYVVVLDDLSAGSMENVKPVEGKAVINLGSVTDQRTVDTIVNVHKIDLIFHLATPCLVKGLEDPKLMHTVTDVGAFNVCLAARDYSAMVIYISTSEVYGNLDTFPIGENTSPDPTSMYGLTKLVGEKYVKFFSDIYQVPAFIIRPFNTYGPRHREDYYACVITNFIKRAQAGFPPIIHGDGFQSRDFTYVTDIVDGIYTLLEKSNLEHGEVVVLGSGRDVSMRDLAEIVWRAYGYSELSSIDWEPPRPHDIRRLQADITLAKSYGYSPKVSLGDGLKTYISWMNGRKQQVATSTSKGS